MFVEPDGRISEGATWNIGFFDGEHLVWPDAEALPGMTMQLIRRAHPDFAIRPVDLNGIAGMDAAFATNVSVGVRPISAINETPLNANNPAISALRNEYLSVEP